MYINYKSNVNMYLLRKHVGGSRESEDIGEGKLTLVVRFWKCWDIA